MHTRLAGDDDLMQAALCGNEAAFSELMRRHRPWVVRLLRAIVRDSDQADDLVQEVFCRVHRHRDEYAGRGRFVSWLRRIAVNVARDTLRRQQTAERFPHHDFPEIPAARERSDPEAMLLARGLRAELRAAIATLPIEQRRAVTLRFFGGQSIAEIAGALGCPPGTVKSRLFHGLRRIRQILTESQENAKGNKKL